MAKIEIKGAIVPDEEVWIYEYFGEKCTSPSAVSRQLEEAGGEKVDIDISSAGGNVFAASEIFAAIQSYKGDVKIHVVGLAASAASVIACAGKSDITRTAQMMVHNASTYAAGDYRDMNHASEVLKQANRAIAAAYVAKSGMSEKDALDLMDAETWITAQDAVDYGLVDEIAGESSKEIEPVALVASGGELIQASVIRKMQERKENLLAYFAKEER